MKLKSITWALVLTSVATVAHAQYPDQFYTNGTKMDVWRAEPGRKTILWFSKEPGDKISYGQSLVIIYDTEPQWAYYVNLGTRKFVGRYSFEKDKYSLLSPDAQKEYRANMNMPPHADFPPPGEMPTVDKLLEGSENENRLLDPPATASYPRLKRSTWDSSYFTDQRVLIRNRLVFNDDRGSFTFTDARGNEHKGSLTGIRYRKTEQRLFQITGSWNLEGAQGNFRFTIAPENLNIFQGEWDRGGRIEGTWSGTRVRPE